MSNRDRIRLVTPATPGFYVVSPLFDESGRARDASRDPVVAWAIGNFGLTFPVTVFEVLEKWGIDGEDESDSYEHSAILTPDGHVVSVSREWGTFEAWLADQKAEVTHDLR